MTSEFAGRVLDLSAFNAVGEAQPALDGYHLEYYSHERPHMGIGKCTPHERYVERLSDCHDL